VAKDGDQVIGWAALSPVSSRDVYAGVVEVSVYIAKRFRGTGVEKTLLSSLVSASESAGV
jgi:phosphinothricin acetyltransferase